MYLLLLIDNFLTICAHVLFSKSVIKKINAVFLCLSKDGPIIKYLNLWICQSIYCISVDQTADIIGFVYEYYPNRGARTTSPIRCDKEYEFELQNSLVLVD